MGDATARATTGDTAPAQGIEEKDDETGVGLGTAVFAIAIGGIREMVGVREIGRGALAETDTRDEVSILLLRPHFTFFASFSNSQ